MIESFPPKQKHVPQVFPNSTPFEVFYETQFQVYLERLADYDSGPIFANGFTIKDASWDRKAAYLLYMLVNGMPPP